MLLATQSQAFVLLVAPDTTLIAATHASFVRELFRAMVKHAIHAPLESTSTAQVV